MRIITPIFIGLFLVGFAQAQSVPKEVVQYGHLLGKECKEGNGLSCLTIGMHYLTGKRVPADRDLAISLFDKACELNEGAGCTHFGYLSFEGVSKDERDFKKAREYYARGCKLGHGYGCTLIGYHHEFGWAAEKDLRNARSNFSDGCSLGDATGCTNLGRMYESGIGMPKDAEKANEYFSRACELGNSLACR